MAYRPLDLLDKFINEETTQFDTEYGMLESILENVEKEIYPFLEAVKKFANTGDADFDALKISGEKLNFGLDQENAGTKKTRTCNKMATLTENNGENIEVVKIKKEKISEISEPTSSKVSVSSTTSLEIGKENVKVEKQDMPAPSWIPPKKKPERPSSRSTRTKGKKAAEVNKGRDSDVIVQSTVTTTINLTDTEDSDNEKAHIEESNTKRTKTATRKQETDSGAETDTESTRSTRSKMRSKAEPVVENVEVQETRSTRTKTLRKGKKVEEESAKGEAEEVQPETRSTRTKTIKKEKVNTQEPSEVYLPSNYNNKENADNGKKAPEESVRSETEESQPETRSTRTKTIRKEKPNTEEMSEINPPSSNNIKETTEVETTRSTRTKTRKQTAKNAPTDPEAVKDSEASDGASEAKQKRNRDSSDEDVTKKNDRKKSKSGSPASDKANTTSQTVYEDARSTLVVANEKQLNATFVTAKPGDPKSTAILNATVTLEPKAPTAAKPTVVVEHSKYNIFGKDSNNDIFTEDESTEEVKTPPKKAPSKKTTTEVFSPYEKTTLKKKVEAFEKLQNGLEIPVRSAAEGRSGRDNPSSIQEKARMFTPSGLKFMPSSCSTTKISRLINSQKQSSSSNSSIVLGSKSSQKDPRERQKKLLEREQALKKKEAMLQAQAEAKRKLNEEKQLKAQQQRKMLEAEKKKQIEVQKQRDLEREEQSQKLKQELERKRLAQKKKLQEMQAQQPAEKIKSRPIYMTTEPPMLPTDDCYDSDDPSYKRVSPPSWCVAEKSKLMQLTMITAGEKIKNTLFCRHAQTPDLQEIFESIDPMKLKRNSSMYWKKPPRYTMMPDLNETKFSEDEELYESD